MNELLPLVALIATGFGAGLSVLQGYSDRKEGETFKVGKLASSLLISVMLSITTVTLATKFITAQVDEIGYVAFIVTYVIQGWGTDKGLSKLDK